MFLKGKIQTTGASEYVRSQTFNIRFVLKHLSLTVYIPTFSFSEFTTSF